MFVRGRQESLKTFAGLKMSQQWCPHENRVHCTLRRYLAAGGAARADQRPQGLGALVRRHHRRSAAHHHGGALSREPSEGPLHLARRRLPHRGRRHLSRFIIGKHGY